MERRIRIGELLLRAGLITELQLKAALAEQQKWGGRLGHVLVEMNFISEDILVKGLSRLLNVPIADFSQANVPDAVLQRFDATDCQNRGYLPLLYSHADKRLVVAFTDVNNLELMDELRFKHGLTIQPAIAGEKALLGAVRGVFYGESFDTGVTGSEPGLKLVNNAGSTLIKHRSEIFGNDDPARAPINTGVERPRAVPGHPVPIPTGVNMPAPPIDDGPSQVVAELEQAQRRQSRAIKTVLELLIEKGIFSREEFVESVNRRAE